MTTSFYYPTAIDTVAEYNAITNQWSIPWNWNPYNISSSTTAITTRPLYTISGLWMEKFLSNTDQLWCTGFNIPASSQTVVGIEVELNVQRASRIEDLIIQLTLNGNIIGDNRASTVNPVQSDMYTGDYTTPLNPVGDYNIYGSSTDLWGTTLTAAQLANSTFGVVISFKSNQIYPHSDLAYVDQVGIRITYA